MKPIWVASRTGYMLVASVRSFLPIYIYGATNGTINDGFFS